MGELAGGGSFAVAIGNALDVAVAVAVCFICFDAHIEICEIYWSPTCKIKKKVLYNNLKLIPK